MLKLRTILTVAVLSLMCGFVMAQPEGPEGGPGCPPDGPKMKMRHEGRPGGDFFKAVNATEEQIEKLKPIMEAQRDKMQQLREANKEKFQAARKAMQEARESKDKDAIAKAKEQMKALLEEGKSLHEQFLKDIATVLSADQVELAKKFFQNKVGNRMREMRGREKGRDMFKQLGLTDDQKAKIKDIMEDARTKAEAAENPKEKREIMEAARKKINEEVLTADQKAKLEKMKPCGEKGPQGRRPGQQGMNMNPLEGIATPEQMEQAKKIMEDAHKQAGEIMKNARKKINDEVLNEEQRKALQEKMEQFKKQHMDKCGPDGRGMGMRGKGPERGREMAMCNQGPDGGRGMKMRDGKGRKHKDPLMSILNEDQKAQAKKIMAEAREKAKAAKTPEEKREIMKAAREKIKKDILTDEQRKQLEEKRKAKKDAPETSMAPEDEDFSPMAMMGEEGPDGFCSEGPEFAPEGCGPQAPQDGPMEFEPAPQRDDFEL